MLGDVLRKPQVNVSHALICLIHEQRPVCSRLLNRLSVEVVSLRPLDLVRIVGVLDQSCEVRLLVGALAGELVDCERDRDRRECDVEAFL